MYLRNSVDAYNNIARFEIVYHNKTKFTFQGKRPFVPKKASYLIKRQATLNEFHKQNMS